MHCVDVVQFLIVALNSGCVADLWVTIPKWASTACAPSYQTANGCESNPAPLQHIIILERGVLIDSTVHWGIA